jgi:fermentation-respiration switch protein FrsA (DUF1100 family)
LPHRQILVICFIAVLAGILFVNGSMITEFIIRNFIFFPTRRLAFTPGSLGMDFEDVSFDASDGVKLSGWLISAGPDSPVVMWFHGNAGNIGDRIENARLLFDCGLSLFMVEYRGYGKSEGKPSEKGIFADGQGAYDYLISRDIAPENLVIFGRSLGSSVAVYVASRNKCAGVVLETAFTNMADMARFHYPIIPGLGNFKDKFNSIERIGSIKSPILFIHGDADELVPYELGRQLFEATTSEKEFYTIPGAHHNDTYHVGRREYFDVFERFVHHKTGKIVPPAS